MKKTILLITCIIFSLSCVFAFTACAKMKYAGLYEMTDISGYVTVKGQRTNLTKDLYEYYTISLKRSGKAVVRTKVKSDRVEYKTEGTWRVNGDAIEITTKQDGSSVVEKMTWKDGVLHYWDYQNSYELSFYVSITLTRHR